MSDFVGLRFTMPGGVEQEVNDSGGFDSTSSDSLSDIITVKGNVTFKELMNQIPGLIISDTEITYNSPSEYDSIIETLPSTPLSSNTQNGDSNNTSSGLLDVMKANSLNQVKAVENQTSVLLAQNELLKEQNKNLSFLNVSLASLSSDSKEQKDLTKLDKAMNISKNKSLKTKLYFETTGKIPKDESELSLMDKFNNVNSENLKNSDDEDIIPMHEEAKKNSELAIETGDMNRTKIDEISDFIFDMLDFGVDSVSDFAEDGVSLDVNPFDFFFNDKDNKQEELNEIKTKMDLESSALSGKLSKAFQGVKK